MGKFNGKKILITGGNSGIGLATAKAFKNEGAEVIITASSLESYERTVKEYGAHFDIIKADVSKLSEVENLMAKVKSKHGKIDVLFANAGIAHFKPTNEIDENFYDMHFNTNVKGLYFTVQKALPILNQGSSVVLTASVASIKGILGSSVYSATKAAVRSLARTWTLEIPVSDVRFNVVSPGPIETPIFQKMGMSEEEAKKFVHSFGETLPAKRAGTAEEIARTVLFLASDDSRFICGAEIFADGGLGQI